MRKYPYFYRYIYWNIYLQLQFTLKLLSKNRKFNITLTIVVHRWWVYGSMFDHCFKQKGFLKAVCTELYIHLSVIALDNPQIPWAQYNPTELLFPSLLFHYALSHRVVSPIPSPDISISRRTFLMYQPHKQYLCHVFHCGLLLYHCGETTVSISMSSLVAEFLE